MARERGAGARRSPLPRAEGRCADRGGARRPAHARGARQPARLSARHGALARRRAKSWRRSSAASPAIRRRCPRSSASGATAPTSAATVELLKVLLRQVSEESGVAGKLIATVDDLEAIAANDKADVPALTGWRRKLFGAARARTQARPAGADGRERQGRHARMARRRGPACAGVRRPSPRRAQMFLRNRFQRLGRHFLQLRNCQAGVSPKCHIRGMIDCGARILRDRDSDF